MPTRAEMDKPAIVIAAALGAVVILGSLPFTVMAFCDQNGCGKAPIIPKDFDITWGELDTGEDTVEVSDATPAAEAVVSVKDRLASRAVITLAPDACVDRYDPQLLQNPATFNYTFVRRLPGGTEEEIPQGSGTFTCSGPTLQDGFTTEVTLGSHPDVAQVQGNSTEEAVKAAWAENPANETAEFVLKLTVYRPPSQLPIPGQVPAGQTEKSATMSVAITHWVLAANERAPEVIR